MNWSYLLILQQSGDLHVQCIISIHFSWLKTLVVALFAFPIRMRLFARIVASSAVEVPHHLWCYKSVTHAEWLGSTRNYMHFSTLQLKGASILEEKWRSDWLYIIVVHAWVILPCPSLRSLSRMNLYLMRTCYSKVDIYPIILGLLQWLTTFLILPLLSYHLRPGYSPNK